MNTYYNQLSSLFFSLADHRKQSKIKVSKEILEQNRKLIEEYKKKLNEHKKETK